MGLISRISGLGGALKSVANWVSSFIKQGKEEQFTTKEAQGLGVKLTDDTLREGKKIIAGTLQEWEKMKYYNKDVPVVKGYVQSTRQNEVYRYSTIVEVTQRDENGVLQDSRYITINHKGALTRNEMLALAENTAKNTEPLRYLASSAIPREGYINKRKQDL